MLFLYEFKIDLFLSQKMVYLSILGSDIGVLVRSIRVHFIQNDQMRIVQEFFVQENTKGSRHVRIN